MIIRQYDLENSLMFLFERELGIRTDLIYDGYEFPDERPLITIEPMQNNIDVLTKQREAVQRIYRYQIEIGRASCRERVENEEGERCVKEKAYEHTMKNRRE